MTTLVDVHREIYRLAAELNDGPDAHRADDVRALADTLVPPEENPDAIVVEDSSLNPDKNADTAARGDAGNTTSDR